ncbi:GPP34 family phosphoprotein [Streptomyces sp. NPDC059837]|uniref:GOLPH3/VPS74 family protein n=1 Tax=unclassified Streptomyces TaxID=2593676 RepID=UPI00225A1864|nr:GPP34 family phosphoprotein [Streptomyces sp. NBC_01764]MCX4402520.1 GPP34 family phosphoprotein [Streptomyces sp. NBC_01764]
MTTARDLLITAMDVDPERPVGQGDLSLALAGAEVIDLLAADAVLLDGDRLVPAPERTTDDRLLAEAASSLVRQVPYEPVEDWLWRRGRGLAAVHLAALEADGQLTRQRRRRLSFGADRVVVVDSPARRRALHRWAADEPVLVSLAAAVGIPAEQGADLPVVTDDAVTTVLAAVNDAVMELEAVRQRRTIENAAFANLWRGA